MNLKQNISGLKNNVITVMRRRGIPGSSIIAIDGDGEENLHIENMGYADIKKKQSVTSDTIFELASCAKGYTSLAVLQLEEKGLLKLDDPVSVYLPWFRPRDRANRKREITLHQLLNHTSGISWKAIAEVSPGKATDALEKAAKAIAKKKMLFEPGQDYHYATVNYTILGAIIEKVTGEPYEEYMETNIFKPLGLKDTKVGLDRENPQTATGYKVGLFRPQRYDAPDFRGNWPAGYVVSTASDVARWLQIQLGLIETPLNDLVERTHMVNNKIPPERGTMIRYAMGWATSDLDEGIYSHSGINPNFCCELIFNKNNNRALAVLTNSGNGRALILCRYLWKMLFNKQLRGTQHFVNPNSALLSRVLVFFMGIYLPVIGVMSLSRLWAIIHGEQVFKWLNPTDLNEVLVVTAIIALITASGWFIPKLKYKYIWKTLKVWKPKVFTLMLRMFFSALGLSYATYLMSCFFV